MSVNKFIFMVFCLTSAFACAASDPISDTKIVEVLDAQKSSLDTGEYRTMDELYALKEESSDPVKNLIALLDYNIGSAATATLIEFLTKYGSVAEYRLRKHRERGLQCIERYESLCLGSVNARNRRIDRILSAIKKGKVLCADETNCQKQNK